MSCLVYRDIDKDFDPIKVFTPYNELNKIFHKVVKNNFIGLDTIMYGQNTYKFTKILHEEKKDVKGRLSKGHENDLTTSIFSKLPELFLDSKPENGKYIEIFGRENGNRIYKWIKKDYIISHENLNCYKVIIPKSNGKGVLGEALSTPIVVGPGVGHTQTFISIGSFKNEEEAKNALKYIKTKFVRIMLGILKITQDNPPAKWKYVPIQDFSNNSDIDWDLNISEIDEYLFKKYKLDNDEINFINNHSREMN